MKVYSFEISISDAVLSLFLTPMECTTFMVVVDIWCPEDARFNRRIRVKRVDYNRLSLQILLQNIAYGFNIVDRVMQKPVT